MKFNRLGIKLVYLLLLMALLAACGQEKVVSVTATAVGDGSRAEEATDEEITVALPPGLQVEESQSQPTKEPAAPERALTEQLADGEMGRIAVMGPMGRDQTMQSFVSNSDGSGLAWVSEEFGEGYFPNLSPDGQRVLLVANTSLDPDIFVVDIASSDKATNLTNQPGFDNQPVWHPDGTQIAFVSNRDGGHVDLWLMDADGQNARRLASTPGNDNLGSWSPDGQKIVYSNKDEVGESLWIIDVASGENTRLTESQVDGDSAPRWSPDGERIAFHSAATDGLPNVFTIRPDGSERQQVTDGSAPALFPIWSPDSQQLLYTLVKNLRYRLYVRSFDPLRTTLESNQERLIPNLEGFATTWRATDERLADTGFTQEQPDAEANPSNDQPFIESTSPDVLALGETVYKENCMSCHGENGEGHIGPALNGSDHTWHHPDPQLVATIRDGIPGTQMVGLGDKLSDEEIEAVISYFKQWWPAEKAQKQRQATEQFNANQ